MSSLGRSAVYLSSKLLRVAHTAQPGGLRTSPLHTALVHRRWLKSSSKDDHATVPVEITAPPISTVPFEVDPQLALKSKSFGEVARAYSLLYLCSFPALVQNADTLIESSKKVVGERLTYFMLKHTLAAQYTGGINLEELAPIINKMNSHNVGAILDYVAEADLDEDVEDDLSAAEDAKTRKAPMAEPTLVEDLVQPNVLNPKMMDRRIDALARTHFFSGREGCIENMEIAKTAIRHAAMQLDAGVTPFAATKITGLLRPAALLEATRVLHLLLHDFVPAAIPTYTDLDMPEPGTQRPIFPDIQLSDLVERLETKFPNLRGDERMLTKITDLVDTDKDGTVDYIEWYKACETIWQDEEIIAAFGYNPISEDDREQIAQAIELSSELAELASELNVRIMFDAEQTYFQRAIDMIVMQLQYKYNTKKPVVFNTIQCYLTDARPRLHIELETHRRLGIKSGFKLVRGAYIIQERKRAKAMGYEDPTCPTLEATHANYDACVLDAISQLSLGTEVLIASHNQRSVELAVGELERRGRPEGAYFGQLLGMGDHLTAAIAERGYRPYKYVPYGPIDECVAYLIRRVQENSTLLAGEPVIKERRMLLDELKRRATGGGG
eukprot:m.117864 g.117864  ORF g.117864 m.117864 type:complete len:612 (-) comp13213_c1_seq2:1523-3358(-)